jgi:hypothetical protein
VTARTSSTACASMETKVQRRQEVQRPMLRTIFRCMAIYRLGCQVLSDLAERARTGKDPARYFSRLL